MLGISIALACAFVWSLSIILLKQAGASVHPVSLNLGKNTFGLMLLLPTAFMIEGRFPTAMSPDDLSRILTSGLIGIGIADALTLIAMKYLTATQIALLECLFAPFVIVLSIIFLGETVNLTQLAGAVLIGGSLILAIPKKADDLDEGHPKIHTILGVVLMSLGLLTMAGGIILVKPVFDSVPLFWVITLRMVAGVVGSIFVFGFFPNRWQMLNELWRAPNKLLIFSAFIASSYIAISLWVAGYKYLQAPLAAILNQTSTIFTVLLAVFILKERLTTPKAIATLLATLGVIIISTH